MLIDMRDGMMIPVHYTDPSIKLSLTMQQVRRAADFIVANGSSRVAYDKYMVETRNPALMVPEDVFRVLLVWTNDATRAIDSITSEEADALDAQILRVKWSDCVRFFGKAVVPFEETSQSTCAAEVVVNSTPTSVRVRGSVSGSLVIRLPTTPVSPKLCGTKHGLRDDVSDDSNLGARKLSRSSSSNDEDYERDGDDVVVDAAARDIKREFRLRRKIRVEFWAPQRSDMFLPTQSLSPETSVKICSSACDHHKRDAAGGIAMRYCHDKECFDGSLHTNPPAGYPMPSTMVNMRVCSDAHLHCPMIGCHCVLVHYETRSNDADQKPIDHHLSTVLFDHMRTGHGIYASSKYGLEHFPRSKKRKATVVRGGRAIDAEHAHSKK